MPSIWTAYCIFCDEEEQPCGCLLGSPIPRGPCEPEQTRTARHKGGDMSAMYRAIQVTKPGEFETVMKPLVDPGLGQVRIRVEASGVCHSDAGTVEGSFPIIWPRVPGHEVVGRIDALGSGVQGWAVGQRVGVGFLGGSCGYCEFWRNGDLVNCRNQEFTGIHSDGGYADDRKGERARVDP